MKYKTSIISSFKSVNTVDFETNGLSPVSGDRFYLVCIDVPYNTFASFKVGDKQVGLIQNNSGDSITTTIFLPVPDESTLTYSYGGSGTPTFRWIRECLGSSAAR